MPADVRFDIAYHPETDVNGNSTSGYRPLNRFSGGAYPGTIIGQDNSNGGSIVWNAVDNAATAIRNDTSLTPAIFTIGLDGNGGVDGVLLKRIANDTLANNYDPSKPIGKYIHTPTSKDLANAFTTIASEVLRISK